MKSCCWSFCVDLCSFAVQARLTIEPGSVESVKRDYGPIMLQFVLPGKPSASGLDVKYMKILKEEKG